MDKTLIGVACTTILNAASGAVKTLGRARSKGVIWAATWLRGVHRDHGVTRALGHQYNPELSQFTRAIALCVGIVGCQLSNDVGAVVVQDYRGLTAVAPNLSLNRYSGVGYIAGGCTGTAISANVVLSAAHCFKSSRTTFSRYYDDQPDVIRGGNVLIHQSYTGAVKSAGDVALVFLDSPLPDYVTTYRLATFVNPRGAVVELAGYGRSGTGSTGQIQGTIRKDVLRYGLNEIDDVINGGNTLLMDLDGGSINRFGSSGLGCAPGHTNPKTGGCTFYPESLTAQGDSGGPAFYSPFTDRQYNPLPSGVFEKPLSSEAFIIGITSYGSCYRAGCDIQGQFSKYGDTTGHTYIAPYLDWIHASAPGVSAFDFTNALDPLADMDYSDASGFAIDGPPLEPVPVPAAAWLFGSGLLGLVGLARRKAA